MIPYKDIITIHHSFPHTKENMEAVASFLTIVKNYEWMSDELETITIAQ